MRISERSVGAVTILELDGRLILEDGENLLREAVDRLVAAGRTSIVLDLQGVSRIDSAGVGMLVCKFLTVFRTGGRLKLLHLSSRTDHLLHLTRLSTIFETFEAEEDAVRSFAAEPPR